jgi:hypothetical protein
LGFVLVLASVGSASAFGEAGGASCHNVGLAGTRSYLPDCRAYELVTPPYKAGYVVVAFPPWLNDSGTELIGDSLGNFAEEAPKVLSELLPYKMERTGSGWATGPLLTSTAPLQRPGKTVYATLLRHFDNGSGTALWDVFYIPSSGIGEPEDVFELQQRDGSFSEVGPVHAGPVHWGSTALTNGPQSVATSVGGGHIVFGNISNGLNAGEAWPGDTTRQGLESLYEFDRTGRSEPLLVGVKNEGRLRHDAEAELVSTCGTILGASFGEKYNALANAGSTVFFTALGAQSGCTGPTVDGLYARVNGERTVAISEPSHQDCESCNVTAGLQAGRYQGASADGSKVYFLTSQELLPGATGNNLYEYDFTRPSGTKVRLVSGGAPEAQVQGVVRLSPDGSHVFFVAASKLTGENAEHHEPLQGADNLYLYKQDAEFPSGHLAFVATLSNADQADWEAPDFSRPAAITPDGRYLVIASTADLTADDTSTQRQLFEYDSKAERLARLSIGRHAPEYPGGYNDNGNTSSEFDQVSPALSNYGGFESAAGKGTLTMSDDGTRVFFQTPLGLTPEASNNAPVGRSCELGVENEAGECVLGGRSLYAQNVYEYRWTSQIGDGNVYLLSGGRDRSAFHEGEAVHLIGADRTGDNVLFTTTERLLSADSDSQVDIYDARVEGGFPETARTGSCTGSSCERPLTEEPSLSAPLSASVTGGETASASTGNVTRPGSSTATSRTQRLAKALKACRRHRSKRTRRSCEAAARKAFGQRSKAARGKGPR